MTEEVNYVIQAAFDYGAEEVLVNDSHSKMNNILIDALHPDALLITGEVKPFSIRMENKIGSDTGMSLSCF